MDTTQILLVRAFLPSVDNGLESVLKRRKDENSASNSTLNVTVTKSCPTPTATTLLSSFLTAVSCWELLQQTEELRNEFTKICLHLRTETWLWLPNFIADVSLHQGLYAEALTKLQSVGSTVLNPQSFLLKSAGIFFGLGNHIVSRSLDHFFPKTFKLKPHVYKIFIIKPLFRQPQNKYCTLLLICH